MSADNWMGCPKCKSDAIKKRNERIEKAKKKYGKISEEEYRQEITAAESPVNLSETLREDYEQGMKENGEYFVSYSGYCSSCGFEFTYSHKQNALVSEK